MQHEWNSFYYSEALSIGQVRMPNSTATLENIWQLFVKLKVHLSGDLDIWLLDVYPRETKSKSKVSSQIQGKLLAGSLCKKKKLGPAADNGKR